MAGNVADPQHSWADRSETEENMGIADIPCYAQMAGRRRHSSVSSQSSVDYIMKNAARLTGAEKDSIHPLNIFPERPCTALRLAGMASMLNSPDDSSFFLFKYFLWRPLSSLLPVWSSLRDNSSPSVSSPTPFYEAFLDTLSKVGDSAIVCNTLYQKLLSINSSQPILRVNGPRSLGKGSPSMVIGLWSGTPSL